MKSSYYVANVVNAYRRALDNINDAKFLKEMYLETEKSSHRQYTTGFYFDNNEEREYLKESMPVQSHDFVAIVLEDENMGRVLIEERNMFKLGDKLEVLSPNDTFNKKLIVKQIETEDGEYIEDARKVQQKLYINSDNLALKAGDILRKKLK